jgi:hypothetical protein
VLQVIFICISLQAHLQAAHMMQFSEEEFLKLLDWSPSDKQQSEHQKAFDVSQ